MIFVEYVACEQVSWVYTAFAGAAACRTVVLCWCGNEMLRALEQVLVKIVCLIFVGKRLVRQILAVESCFAPRVVVAQRFFKLYNTPTVFSSEYCSFSQQYCAFEKDQLDAVLTNCSTYIKHQRDIHAQCVMYHIYIFAWAKHQRRRWEYKSDIFPAGVINPFDVWYTHGCGLASIGTWFII